MLTRQATMTTYFGDGSPSEDWPCEVRFDDEGIVVSYWDDNGPVVYKGRMMGEGHYRLESARPEGEANLHCFRGGILFDGWWNEDGAEGMWRIKLRPERPIRT